ncbi:MAG: ribonuclease PH, partial [Alphaproteobacteria bacterium]
TNSRNPREAAKGKQSGRTQEIQRLIGRSLRSTIDLALLGERQLVIDCDVIEADGGTRTASITGGFVALHGAILTLMRRGIIKKNPIQTPVAAISCGVVAGEVRLDLDYEEDSAAEVDANIVLTGQGNLVEVQMSGEEATFTPAQLQKMLEVALTGGQHLLALQKEALR